jgi:5'-3' exonuclease
MAELQSIYFESLPDMLYERVKKNRPLIVRRREDFDVRVAKECNKLGIRVIQAPFEADWQLVEAQRAGLIDIILSEDGGLFVLGGA